MATIVTTIESDTYSKTISGDKKYVDFGNGYGNFWLLP